MQTASAPSRWRRWLRWGRVLLLGMVLGMLQFLLLTQAAALEQWSASSLPAVAIGALLYLLIPALAGFLAARQSGGASSGTGSGCLVGGIGLLAIAVASILANALTPPPPPPPPCPPDCPRLPPKFFTTLEGEGIFYIMLLEVLGGVAGSLLGGRLGGVLGQIRARGLEQSGEWRRRGRALLLGIALALLQTLVLVGAWLLLLTTSSWPLALGLALALSALCFLLIPAIEGFLTSQQNEGGCSGVNGGCLVGLMNILAIAIAVTAFLVLVAPRLESTCRGGCSVNDNGFLVGLPLAFLAFQGLGSIFGGILGGWMGGVLRQRQATRPRPGSETAANPAP